MGFALSWFGLRAAALVAAGPTPSYPFGREALAPLVVAAQALVLAGTFGYAAVDAVGVILDGGGETEVGSALVYSVLSLLAAMVVRQVLVRWRAGSDLVAAVVDQWHAGVILGVAMVIGFSVAVALEGSAWSNLAPFVDPVLVLVAAGLILPTPVRMLRQAFRELLEGVPDASVTDPIHAAITRVRTGFGLPGADHPDREVGAQGVPGAGLSRRRGPGVGARRRRSGAPGPDRGAGPPGQLLWVNVELHTDPGWDT